MTQSVDQLDRLIDDYLGAISYACRDLPAARRDDLISDLREHITAARAVLYQPTEAAIRTILDRLGDPTTIATEALASEGLPTPPPPPGPRPIEPPTRWLSRPLSPTTVTILAIATLIALTLMVIAYTMTLKEPPPAIR